jgi:hypothetical protein
MKGRRHKCRFPARLLGAAILALVIVFSHGDLPAQTATASIHGVVTDPSASLIPKAAVTVSNSQAFARTVLTDARGRYQVNGLAAGTYTIKAGAPGFTAKEQSGYEVQPGRSQTFDISLALSTQAEQVTVAAADTQTSPSAFDPSMITHPAWFRLL